MRSLSSFFRAAPSVKSVGPCFRTDAEGRIPLTRDWLALFAHARSFTRPVLQTRHRCARLLVLGPVPAFAASADRSHAYDPAGNLHFYLAHWHHASGRLAHCPCCGSPGRVEIHDAHGAEFLQLCAHSEDEPAAWASYLSTVSAPLNATLPPPPVSPAINTFVRLPADARLLTRDVDALPALISLLADEETRFACTLRTPAVTHTRELIPRRVIFECDLLTVADGTITLQAALGLAEGLAVETRDSRPHLHLIGPGRTSLLTLQPAADPVAAFLWGAALRTAFPSLD